MSPRKKILGTLQKEIPYLKKNFGVKRIAIFGSFAKGTLNSQSDVDILVEFSSPVGFKFIEFADYLEKKLGRKTDILTPAGIKGIRIKRVARDIKKSLMYV